MRLGKSAAWVACTAAALLATSACGTEGAKTAAKTVDSAGKAMAALARATDRTEALGSAEVRTTTDLGNGTPIAMDGTYSWGDGNAMDVEMDTKAAKMQALQHSPKIRCLFVGGSYYYNVDPLASGPYKGKTWIKIDGSAIFGEKGAQALAGSGGSPSASLKGLKYANDADNLGTQTVDGRRATHYRAVVDQAHMGKFKEAYGKDSPMGSALGVKSITMDVWVGSDDLPVRMKQQMGTMTVTLDFDKFGKTATVKAPPASKTADLTDVVKRQQQRRTQG
ncbi:hypothetical protein [Streptomyces sp. NPDC020298]|uniref:hypothetical protein n=1 Tax=unclassified Streptomyces TaxID=2593676 RepID=UPI0033CC9098